MIYSNFSKIFYPEGEANYRRSTPERAASAREIEIKWFGQVFSEPA